MLTLVAALVPLMSGCVDREVKGDAVEFSFEGWVGMTVLLVGLAAAPIGLMLRESWKKGMWVGLVMSPVLLLGVMPSMFLDYAKVDSQHFEGRYGIWFAPTKFDVKYADLNHIDHVTYETRGRRGRKSTKYRLDCVTKSGQVQKVSLGDMMKEARDDILERASAAGVAVRDVDERK